MADGCHAIERSLIVAYLRHLATVRPADANGLRVAAADIESDFHYDDDLNPAVREFRRLGGSHWERIN